MELAMANGFFELSQNEMMEVDGGDALSEVCKFVTGTVVGVGAYIGAFSPTI